jgi:hypothetical protein
MFVFGPKKVTFFLINLLGLIGKWQRRKHLFQVQIVDCVVLLQRKMAEFKRV